jgi:hypothetical protein
MHDHPSRSRSPFTITSSAKPAFTITTAVTNSVRSRSVQSPFLRLCQKLSRAPAIAPSATRSRRILGGGDALGT